MPASLRHMVLGLAVLAGSLHGASGSLHPPVVLKDSTGTPVLQSGGPVSTLVSCGDCHDTHYISGHNFHSETGYATLRDPGDRLVDPLSYDGRQRQGHSPADGDLAGWLARFGARHVGGGAAAAVPGGLELDCFLCHLPAADTEARAEALAQGQFAWANTATLASTGLVSPRSGGGFSYRAEAFDAKGQATWPVLPLEDPRSGACAPCHMVEHRDLDHPLHFTPEGSLPRDTRLTGTVFSPQRIRESGLNLAGKDGLDRAWDIHAERGLECVDCHHSLNNPVYYEEHPATRPDHLAFDARRLSLNDYLLTPSHQLARGHASGLEATAPFDHSMRRCESCHLEETAHDWLPYAASHFKALSCEACHIPQLYSSALQAIDWSLPGSGQPRLEHRGSTGDPADGATLVEGYAPVLLPRRDSDGQDRLAPFNLVSSWYWTESVDGTDQVIPLDRLEAVLAPAGQWRTDLLALLDRNGDGQLQDAERVLSDKPRVEAVQGMLSRSGIRDPRLQGQLDPLPVHHGTTGPGYATRDCDDCHARDSRLATAFTLASAWPSGVMPRWNAPGTGDEPLPGELETRDGVLSLAPDGGQVWLLGHHSLGWVNGLGLASLVLVIGMITVHGTLRWRTARRLPGPHHGATERVYMYSRYERFWHWLQALAIAGLITTGLTVHAPGLFAFSSFQTAVELHTILGFVLLANAAFSLFYHVAGGDLRQYLPTPRGFFNQAIRQLLYYTKGIFRGEPHPFEKTPGKKLNPLQKVAYLVILNLLLPFQILSGIAIWGAQHWPDLAERLGGLGLLVPLHSLGAWLFASFLVMHLYLTTTGHTVTSNLKAMVSGYENLPRGAHGRTGDE